MSLTRHRAGSAVSAHTGDDRLTHRPALCAGQADIAPHCAMAPGPVGPEQAVWAGATL